MGLGELIVEIVKAILGWLLIIWIAYLIINRKNKKEEKELQKKQNIYSNIEPNKKLLTETEKQFYKMIKPICDKYKLNINTQVAMNQIIKATNYETLNVIGGKSIDFVLTDQETKIKLCIELDDYTHEYENRKKRDEIVNNMFEITNTKLLRIPTEKAFVIDRIEKQIKESL